MYLPGEVVETSGEVRAGRGAYVDEEGVLRASIAGRVVVVDGAASVVGAGRTADAPMARDLVVKVGSVVTGTSHKPPTTIQTPPNPIPS
jgi:exosome complex RNA-binding protein Rrp4